MGLSTLIKYKTNFTLGFSSKPPTYPPGHQHTKIETKQTVIIVRSVFWARSNVKASGKIAFLNASQTDIQYNNTAQKVALDVKFKLKKKDKHTIIFINLKSERPELRRKEPRMSHPPPRFTIRAKTDGFTFVYTICDMGSFICYSA